MKGSTSWSVVSLVTYGFLESTFTLGTVKLIGVILPALQHSLGTSATEIGVALGLLSAFKLCSAPFLACLYRRADVRFQRGLLVLGSVLPTLGVITASLAGTSAQLAICLAVSGLGYGMMNIFGVVSLNDLAGERFGVLLCVAKSGTTAGMVLIPLLGDFLSIVYGWTGALLITGGIISHTIPVAMCIHPKTVDESHQRDDADGDREDDDDTQVRGPLLTGEEEKVESSNDNMDVCHGDVQRESMNIQSKEIDISCDERKGGVRWKNCPGDDDVRDQSHLNEKEISRCQKDHLEIASTCSSSLTPSDSSLKGNDANELEEESDESDCHNRSCWFEECGLFRDPYLALIFLAFLPFGMVYGSWHAFLIPRAVESGMSTLNAIALSAAAAASNLASRIVAGIYMRSFDRYMDLFLLLAAINVLSLTCDVIAYIFPVMLVTSCLSSFSLASRALLTILILRQRAPSEYFHMAIALDEFVGGVAAMLGSYLSGLIADRFRSFNYSFIMLAILDSLSFLLLVPVRCAHKH
ncbi:monocarboxylate transporter 5-like [Diadema antillarum]|uniref:monocarboxylate transporter 5-like n=1 Tax=Diadema antillarum TaxID=105358 RepID=UPI003A8547A1